MDGPCTINCYYSSLFYKSFRIVTKKSFYNYMFSDFLFLELIMQKIYARRNTIDAMPASLYAVGRDPGMGKNQYR